MGAYYIYVDRAGDWRWRYTSTNGNIIADSAEGYRNKADCLRGIDIMKASSGSPVYQR